MVKALYVLEHLLQKRFIKREEERVIGKIIMPKSLKAFGNLKIHLKTQEVYRNGNLISLSNQEFLVLWFLAKHQAGYARKKKSMMQYAEKKL